MVLLVSFLFIFALSCPNFSLVLSYFCDLGKIVILFFTCSF